jgi:hypothetical protein
VILVVTNVVDQCYSADHFQINVSSPPFVLFCKPKAMCQLHHANTVLVVVRCILPWTVHVVAHCNVDTGKSGALVLGDFDAIHESVKIEEASVAATGSIFLGWDVVSRC